MKQHTASLVFFHSDPSTQRQSQISAVRSYTATRTWQKRRGLRHGQLINPPRRPYPPQLLPAKGDSNRPESEATAEIVAATPRPPLFRGNSDPFSAASIEITPLAHELLSVSFYWQLFHDYPIWATALYEDRVRASQNELTQSVLGDPAMLHCLLAAGYYIKSQNNEAASVAALAHKTHVLGIMQVRLTAGADISMLIDYLVLMESFVGNFHAAQSHWQALKTYAHNAPQAIQPNLLHHLWIQDVWLAHYLHRKTALDISSWNTPAPKISISSAESPPKQHPPVPLIDHHLQSLLTGIRHFVALRSTALSMSDSPDRDELVRWLHLQNAALDGRLLNHLIDLSDIENNCSPTKALNAAFTLALRCYFHLIWFSHPFGDVQLIDHKRFDTLLQQAITTHPNLDHDLLLWLYFMCAINDTLLPTSTAWAIVGFANMRAMHPSWDDVRIILEKFLYFEGMEERLTANHRNTQAPFQGVYFLYQKLWLAEWHTERKKTIFEARPDP